jgi:quinohemoprotein ethanol dehydrogenase
VDWEPTVVFNPPKQTASPETLREGFALYQDTCITCHGLNAVSGLLLPDLRGSGYLHDAKAWDDVVRGGALRARGMAAWNEVLDEKQSEAIRAYVIQQAWRGLELQRQSKAE